MDTKQPHLFLASSSPRRQSLIQLMGLPYHIVSKPVDERLSTYLPPQQVVCELSLRKAWAVHEELLTEQKDGVIVGADTVVVLKDNILGKPQDEQDAFHMLASLQGSTHEVMSGIACVDVQSGKHLVKHCKTSVTMKPLTRQQIKRYIQTGEPLDKAGAYGIQGFGALIVDKIEGDYFNVVGLSVSLLADMLCEFGIEVI